MSLIGARRSFGSVCFGHNRRLAADSGASRLSASSGLSVARVGDFATASAIVGSMRVRSLDGINQGWNIGGMPFRQEQSIKVHRYEDKSPFVFKWYLLKRPSRVTFGRPVTVRHHWSAEASDGGTSTSVHERARFIHKLDRLPMRLTYEVMEFSPFFPGNAPYGACWKTLYCWASQQGRPVVQVQRPKAVRFIPRAGAVAPGLRASEV